LGAHRLAQLLDYGGDRAEGLVELQLELGELGADHVRVHLATLLTVDEVFVDVGFARQACVMQCVPFMV
jgi:hypothetical protein